LDLASTIVLRRRPYVGLVKVHWFSESKRYGRGGFTVKVKVSFRIKVRIEFRVRDRLEYIVTFKVSAKYLSDQ